MGITNTSARSDHRTHIKVLSLSFALLLSGCSEERSLKPFNSDGCSMFLDRSLINEDDWCECCFEHDLAYWQGGSKEARLQADRAFRQCITEVTGNRELAEVMYAAVRLGGSPYYYSWYRWGYGWNYGRTYQELTDQEEREVEIRLNEYFNSEHLDDLRTHSPCESN